MTRIASRFTELRRANRAAFIPFITAGDPDAAATAALLAGLPQAGADIIELGVPFSDPMADGPAVQASSLRALKAGMTLDGVLELVRGFRKRDGDTPVVLMGYMNPIHAYGVAGFAKDAGGAGVDGLITVDLPPEEDSELRAHAKDAGIDIIRLATPTTGDRRLGAVLDGASGFLYYVSITGVTGATGIAEHAVREAVARLKAQTALPVAVGFGIKTPEQAREIARFADGAVVGSAIVSRMAQSGGEQRDELVKNVLDFCCGIAQSVHTARA